MKYIYILMTTVCLHFCASQISAQGHPDNDINTMGGYVGISPQFYKGFDYKKGEFDVDIFPFMLKGGGYSRFGFRIQPHCFLGFRNEKKASVKSFGIELAVPFQILLHESEERLITHRATIAAGTIIMANRTAFERETSINQSDLLPYFSFFVEPAYTIYFDYEFGFSFGIQLGKSLIRETNYNSFWGDHLAIRVSFIRGLFL